MMDGRVKTLHPRVHGGLLALRDDVAHRMAMDQNGILPIDLLVVNLYPFEETLAADATRDEIVENIDIGGPAMLRAGAKNHAWVTVLADPDDYDALLEELDAHDGATTLAFRRRMAAQAYARTAGLRCRRRGLDGVRDSRALTPRRRSFGGTLAQELRYGENPHQRAAFYRDGSAGPASRAPPWHQGKDLSWNNFNDTDAAFELVSEFDPGDGPACVIVKHANPCGVARGATLIEAYRARLRLRPDLGLRRHRRAEPPARPRHRGGDRRDLHRGGDRPRGRGRARPGCSRPSPTCGC